jgi:hypothetical protein
MIQFKPQSVRAPRLHRDVITLLRVVWLVTVAGSLGLYALSIPLQVQELQTLCADNCQFGQLTAGQLPQLSGLGLSFNLYAGYNNGLDTILFLVFVTVGGVIFWRKSDDWFGIYVALTLVVYALSWADPLPLLANEFPGFGTPLLMLKAIGSSLLGLFFYWFPDGRFVPRWSRWLIPVVLAREFAYVFAPDSPLLYLFPIELGTFIFAQVYRYITSSDAVERQ